MIIAMWMHKCNLEIVKLLEYVLFPALYLAHFECLSPHFSAMATFDSCDAHQAGTKWSNYCKEFSKFEALVKRMESVYGKCDINVLSIFSLSWATFWRGCISFNLQPKIDFQIESENKADPRDAPALRTEKQKRLQLNPEI